MSQSGNKAIAINSVYIFFKLIITSVISLVASRWVLDALGASDYGLYSVIGGIVVILNLLNTAMITTTYRYIAYEMGKGDNGDIRKVFCASLTIHFFLAVGILIFGLIIGLWYIDNYLKIDAGNFDDARFILLFSIITTSISTVFVPFQGLLVAYEKFSVSAVIEIISKLVFIFAVYYILCQLHNGVRSYTIIQLTVTVLTCSLYFGYCQRKYRYLIKYSFVRDKKLYKEMSSFTGWTLLGATSYVGQTQGSATVLNYFFGTGVNAAFAVANQVENFISMFARNLSQAAIPQITKSYSGGDNNRSVNLTGYISKYTFILMSIVAFPLLLEMDFVLGVWLKEVPKEASLFCKLLIINGLITSLNSGIPALIQATGRIKVFQIIGSTLSILSIPISIVLYLMGSMSQTIIIVFTVTSILNLLVDLFLLRQILNINIVSFFKVSYSRVLFISAFLIVGYILYRPSYEAPIQHIIGMVFSEFYLLLLIFIFGVDKKEKELLKRYYKSIVKRHNNNL